MDKYEQDLRDVIEKWHVDKNGEEYNPCIGAGYFFPREGILKIVTITREYFGILIDNTNEYIMIENHEPLLKHILIRKDKIVSIENLDSNNQMQENEINNKEV